MGLNEVPHDFAQKFRPGVDMLGQLRTLAGPELFDLEATADKMGIFQLKDKHQHGLIGQFIVSLHDKLLHLEQDAYSTTSGRKDELSRLSQLVTFFSRITYLSDDIREQKKYIQRFEFEKHAYLYLPNIQSKHAKEIVPFESYDFGIPAEIEFSIRDQEKGNKLIMKLFPVEYSYYKNRPDLAGASKADARSAMATQNGQGRGHLDHMIETLEGADKTRISPYFSLCLEDNGGDVISRLSGNLTEQSGLAGFDLFPEEMPASHVFIPIQAARKHTSSTPLAPQMVMQTFCKTLLPLQTRSFPHTKK